jgi:hypothetical protein
MKPTEQAQKYFTNNFSCSQSVFAAFAPDMERIQKEGMFKKRCSKYVATATQIVEKHFDEQ